MVLELWRELLLHALVVVLEFGGGGNHGLVNRLLLFVELLLLLLYELLLRLLLLELLLDAGESAQVHQLLLDLVAVLLVLGDVPREVGHHVKRTFIEKTNVFSFTVKTE